MTRVFAALVLLGLALAWCLVITLGQAVETALTRTGLIEPAE